MKDHLKAYLVTIGDYDPVRVEAVSAAKARWSQINAFREAFGNRHMSVSEILSRTKTLHLGRVQVHK